MSDLTEEEKKEIARVLNCFEDVTINVAAHFRKYDADWYENKLDELDEMENHINELERIIELEDEELRNKEELRGGITTLRELYNRALESANDDRML